MSALPPSARVIARELSYRPAAGLPLRFQRVSFSLGEERVGVVGENGAGKSTLLRLLVGELAPEGGSVVRRGPVGYLPQVAPPGPALVVDVLGEGEAFRARQRLLDGGGTPDDAARVGDRWDLEGLLEPVLAEHGLGGLSLDDAAASLSGGEQLRLRLAGLSRQAPDALLLDEPTTHLDRAGRAWLLDKLRGWRGVVVVSHDRELLGEVDRIVEVRPPGLVEHGGDHAHFLEQRAVRDAAAARALQDAEKEERRRRREQQEARERQDRRNAAGRRRAEGAGVPRVVLGKMRERAQTTTARLRTVGEDRVVRARDEVREARTRVAASERLGFDATATTVPAAKTIARAEGLRWATPTGRPVLEDLTFVWRGPLRVAVTGDNGTGKSTLLRLLAGTLSPTGGHLEVGAEGVALLDQRLALPLPEASVLENLRAARPDLADGACREALAGFLFRRDRVFQPAASLSGGERLRLVLATVLVRARPPQLLLLDEPESWLDLPSLEHLERVLLAFQGALAVVSHDAVFLERLALTEVLELGRSRSGPPPPESDDDEGALEAGPGSQV